jgi:hypothetical protein
MNLWNELATKHAREARRVITMQSPEIWRRVITKQAPEIWGVITKHTRVAWRVINEARHAPLIAAVIISGIIISGILGAVFSWLYQAAMIQKDEAINTQQITITNLNSMMEDLRAENARLRSKISATSAHSIETPKNSPRRDPDAIFQLGTQVGKVTGTEVYRENSTVMFKSIFSRGNFNPNDYFEYRDLVLHIKNMGHSMSGKLLGEKIKQYINVECLIAGRSEGIP